MRPFTVTELTAIIRQLLPEPHAGLLEGLMFGTKTAMPKDLYDALVLSGTIHIAALSGQNLAILGRLISDQLVGVVGKRIASALTLLVFVWFVVFVGPSPSIVRAAIMGSLALLAVLLGRQYWSLLSWGIAVAVMLLFNGSWLMDRSFQLSALATLGIIVFGTPHDAAPAADGAAQLPNSFAQKTARGWRAWIPQALVVGIRDDLRLTIAAQSLTVPLVFFHFHRISLIAPFANLAIGWIIGPLTGLGWVTVIAGWVWLPLGQAWALVDWVFLEYLVRTVQYMSSIPFSSVGM